MVIPGRLLWWTPQRGWRSTESKLGRSFGTWQWQMVENFSWLRVWTTLEEWWPWRRRRPSLSTVTLVLSVASSNWGLRCACMLIWPSMESADGWVHPHLHWSQWLCPVHRVRQEDEADLLWVEWLHDNGVKCWDWWADRSDDRAQYFLWFPLHLWMRP